MAAYIKGITVKLTGDTSGLVKSLKSVDEAIKQDNAALKTLENSLKLDPGNIDLLAAKQQVLAEKTQHVTDKMNILKQLKGDALEAIGNGADIAKSSMAQLEAELANTNTTMKSLDKESDEVQKSLDEIGKTEADDAMEDLDKSSKDAADGLDKVEKNAKGAKDDIKETGTASDTASDKMEKFGEVAAKVGKAVAEAFAAALAAATAVVTAVAKASVEAGMEFDSAMSQVAATMGTTVDDIQDLRDFAQEMGSSTAFSATEAAEALNYMALAGYDAKTSMEMLPTVLNLAAAGNIGLAEASDMVTDAQSALGLSCEQTTEMVDQMAKASSSSNTSVAQLGDAILTIGATAANVAGGTQELATLFGVLADNGIKGSEAGTKLRNVILSLQENLEDDGLIHFLNGTEEVTIALYDEEGNMRSLVDVIGDLQDGMEGMTQAEQDAVVGGLFNKGDLAAVNALLNTTSERYDELSTKIGDAGGAAEQMADTQLDNLAGDITIFKSALEGAEITISDVLSPTLREFVQMGTDGVSRITEAFKTGGLEGAFAELGTWLGEVVPEIVKIIPSIVEAGAQLLEALANGIVDNFDVFIDGFKTLLTKAADWLSDPENIQKMVTGIMDMTTQLVNTITDLLPIIVPALVTLITGIATTMTDPAVLGPLLTAVLDCIMEICNQIMMNADELSYAVINIIWNIIQTLGEHLPEIIEFIIITTVEGLGTLFNLIIGMFGGHIEDIFGNFDEIAMFIANWFTESVGNFLLWLTEVGTNLGEWLAGVFLSISDWFSNAFTTISEKLGEIWDKINEVWNDVTSGLTEFFSGLWDTITQKVQDVIDKVGEMKDGITEKITEVVNNALQWGKDLMQNLIDGIQSMMQAVINKAKSVAEAIAEFLHFSVPEKGPLSDFDESGADMIDTFINSMNSKRGALDKAMNSMAGIISGDLNDIEFDSAIDSPAINQVRHVNKMEELINQLNSMRHTRGIDEVSAKESIIIPVYIGNEKLDTLIVDGIDRYNYTTGGH